MLSRMFSLMNYITVGGYT